MTTKTYPVIGLGLAMALVGLLIWAVQGASSTSARPLAVTLVINAQLGETFAPAPASARPALTSDQAFGRYAKLNGVNLTHPLGNTTAYLGRFTLPINRPRTRFTAHNELAYGYATPSGCLYTVPHPPQACTEWTFLDANSGAQIVTTWSPTSGP